MKRLVHNLAGFLASFDETRKAFLGGFAGGMAFLLIVEILPLPWREPVEEVLAASHALSPAGKLEDTDLTVVRLPRRYTPKTAVTPEHRGLIARKRPRTAIEPGEVIRWADLETEHAQANHLSGAIPDGLRAFSLPLEQAGGLKKWLKPGDFVDVIGTFRTGENAASVTRTLFQDLRILKTRPQLVLLVTPEQVELLTFAEKQGRLAVSLRSPEDRLKVGRLPDHSFRKFLGWSASPGQGPGKNGPQILRIGEKKAS